MARLLDEDDRRAAPRVQLNAVFTGLLVALALHLLLSLISDAFGWTLLNPRSVAWTGPATGGAVAWAFLVPFFCFAIGERSPP